MLREFRTLIPFVKSCRWWWYIAGILSLIVTDSAQLLVPQFVKRGINVIVSGSSPFARYDRAEGHPRRPDSPRRLLPRDLQHTAARRRQADGVSE